MNKPDLVVISVQIQPFLANLKRRSIRMDVLATDSAGVKYNIEIQRADKGAGFKRARYHSSMMDANLLKKGKDFNKLPETYVIFITENDVIGDGQPVYHIERYIFESGRVFSDGAHILYVNGAYRGDTPVGKLMHDFFCTDPDDMNYDILADRVRYFKEEKEGVAIMCKAMEDIFQEGMEKGIEKGTKKTQKKYVIRMLDAGEPLEKIAKYSGLSLDKVKKLQAKRAL